MGMLPFPWKNNIRLKNFPHRHIFRKIMPLPFAKEKAAYSTVKFTLYMCIVV